MMTYLDCQDALSRAVAACSFAKSELVEVLLESLRLAYPTYQELEERAINPIEHHLTVLDFAARILAAKEPTAQNPLHLLSVALLHDLGVEEKITTQKVSDAEMELRRTAGRLRHMLAGAEAALKIMLDVNLSLGRVAFDADALVAITAAIARHDWPSLRRSIADDSLLVSFTACDALWMISHPHGPRADLVRQGKDADDTKLLLEQLRHNITNVRKRLAAATGRSFVDCFASPTAANIFRGEIAKWEAELGFEITCN